MDISVGRCVFWWKDRRQTTMFECCQTLAYCLSTSNYRKPFSSAIFSTTNIACFAPVFRGRLTHTKMVVICNFFSQANTKLVYLAHYFCISHSKPSTRLPDIYKSCILKTWSNIWCEHHKWYATTPVNLINIFCLFIYLF